jgi:transcriptional regulator of acetoin/glycerol metabolism
LQDAEREVLLGMIAQHRWNMSQVAAQLGISRNTLYRKIKRHGIVIARRPGGC